MTKTNRKTRKNRKNGLAVFASKNKKGIMIAATIALLIVSYIVYLRAMSASAESAYAEYKEAKETAKAEIQQKYYDDGKKNWQTTNDVTINLGDLKEKMDLRVLELTDAEYSIRNTDNTAWIRVTGMGMYSVNLAAADFIVDNTNGNVTVQLMTPKLTTKITKAELLKYENNRFIFNGSIAEGEQQADEQVKEAYALVVEEFTTNPEYLKKAKENAVETIKQLVVNYNPNVLTSDDVNVIFFDE